MRRLAIGFALLLSGCDTSVHDLLYFPGLSDEKPATSGEIASSEEANAPPQTPAVQSTDLAMPSKTESTAPPPRATPPQTEGPRVASNPPTPVMPAIPQPASEPTMTTAAPAPEDAAPSLSQPSTSVTSAIATHCQDVAQVRTSDAALNGLDDDLQQAIHDRTYSDCVAWQTKHGPPSGPQG